jgi:hypothetical protein
MSKVLRHFINHQTPILHDVSDRGCLPSLVLILHNFDRYTLVYTPSKVSGSNLRSITNRITSGIVYTFLLIFNNCGVL